MSKKRKPHAERTPEDYMEAAESSMELAKVLVGKGAISDQDFLERMARSDELVDHDRETCGQFRPSGVLTEGGGSGVKPCLTLANTSRSN